MMQPFFINSRSGPLFALYWPATDHRASQAILHIPAFAEEMNKSRQMVALQASALAQQGYAVLVLDLLGSGDSRGDFGEATWQIWLENIADAIAWLQQQGIQSINLWGLRLGALLAMDFIHQNPGWVERLIAWQPVLNGDTFVTQFLRLRVAAAMMNSTMPQEKTSDLKRQLQSGETLEVAGYQLHPDLITPLQALKAESLNVTGLKNLLIFDWVASVESEPSLASQKFFATQNMTQNKAELLTFTGDSFWASQEITTAPSLIEMTRASVRQWL